MGGGVKKRIVICRCEDVTLEDIERAIDSGVTDIETLKRMFHLGMGPCQGRTCIPLVASILARRLGKSPEELLIPPPRPPLTPLPVWLLKGSVDAERGGEG